MPITLAEAQVNCQDDVDFAIIDDLRRRSWLFDQLTFDQAVNPAGGGATLTYGYTRLVTAATATFRAINAEYTPGEAVRTRETVDLKPLGGSFNVDRVLANLGPAATNEEAFQFAELNKGAITELQNQLINADTAVNANGFDGLDKALAGTTTETFGDGTDPATNQFLNWTSTGITDESGAHTALDMLDELVSLVEGGADAIMGNDRSIARVRSIARRAGYYTRSEDSLGRVVEMFGNSVLVDLGFGNDGTSRIVPIESRDVDGDGGTTPAVTGLTDLYAVRFDLDAFHGVATVGELVKTYRPDYTAPGAVKLGELEIGPVAPVLKSTRGAAVLRNVKVM
ncbi:major capsid protein [Promicromonospora vindobonensis]|uniref:Major capsid protein n=1 Tax=Promicromonospora vindobonensis TaxID=195748 RepID=A0ABW5VQR7_9MICO